MKSGYNQKALIALYTVSFFWGTTYLASRIGAENIPGFFLGSLRQFIAGSILLIYFFLKRTPLPDRESLRQILSQGIFMLVIGNGMSTWSVQYITSGLAAVIAAIIPLTVVLFSILLLKNARFTRKMILGLVIGFIGILAIFYEYLDDLLNPHFAFGILLALGSILSWSFGTVYTSKNNIKIPVLQAVGWQMFLSGCIMLPVSYLLGQSVNIFHINSAAWLALAYLVSIGSILCFSLYVYSIKSLPPALASIYAYINPIIAVFLGWFILNEKLNLNVGFGTVVTIAGVYLVNNEFRKQLKSKRERQQLTMVESEAHT